MLDKMLWAEEYGVVISSVELPFLVSRPSPLSVFVSVLHDRLLRGKPYHQLTPIQLYIALSMVSLGADH